MNRNIVIILLSTAFLFLICNTLSSCKQGCRDATATNYCFDCDSDCSKSDCCNCCTYSNNPNPNPNPQNEKGAVIFWTSTTNYGFITVTLNGSQNTITTAQTFQPPCLSSYGAYYYLKVGSHTYSASSQSGKVWSGNLTVANGCNRVLLN